jgi:hypothetical protein
MECTNATEVEVVTHALAYHVTFAHDIAPRYQTPGRPTRRPEPSPCSTPAVAQALALALGDPVAVRVSRYDASTEGRTAIEVVDLRHVAVAGDDWPALIEAAKSASRNAGVKVHNRSRAR